MLYSLIRFLGKRIGRYFFNLKVHNAGNIPPFGGVIIASNHSSHFDPPLIGTVIDSRKVFFMARASLFKNFIMSRFLRIIHAFPIDTKSKWRGQGIREAKKLLVDGKAVVVFPEGTRSLDGQIKEGKPGIGFLVLAFSMPLIPVHIKGTFEAFPKGKILPRRSDITVTFGKPLYFEEFYEMPKNTETYKKVVDKIMSAIRDLSKA